MTRRDVLTAAAVIAVALLLARAWGGAVQSREALARAEGRAQIAESLHVVARRDADVARHEAATARAEAAAARAEYDSLRQHVRVLRPVPHRPGALAGAPVPTPSDAPRDTAGARVLVQLGPDTVALPPRAAETLAATLDACDRVAATCAVAEARAAAADSAALAERDRADGLARENARVRAELARLARPSLWRRLTGAATDCLVGGGGGAVVGALAGTDALLTGAIGCAAGALR